MRVVRGSDWLSSQEQLARRRISELQQSQPPSSPSPSATTTRTVTQSVEREIPVSLAAHRSKLVLKLFFWTGPLFLCMSFFSFCGLLFLNTEGYLELLFGFIAIPVGVPVSSLIAWLVGGTVKLGGELGLSKELVFVFDLFFIFIYFFLFIKAYSPHKKEYRKETITTTTQTQTQVEHGETEAQRLAREREISQWETKLKNVRAGKEAEDRTCRMLGSFLDDNWTLYRNVTLPDGRKDDIDGVLVGPSGVFSLEIKAYSGYHRYAENIWEIWMGGSWQGKQWNPARQAAQGAERLISFFAEKGVEITVESRVVWAGAGQVKIIGRPQVLIWFLSNPNSSDWIRKDLLNRRRALSAGQGLMINRVLG